MRETRPLLICMVASEALPYAKSGGLADVAGSLPKALAGTGCRVLLFHPLYRTVRERFPRLDLVVDRNAIRICRNPRYGLGSSEGVYRQCGDAGV